MNNNIKKGFTLLETIVAVSVLVTAIIGPFNLASQTIQAQSIARNDLIAANFAQEGIELFRNYRSNNVLRADGDTTHWLDGTAACETAEGCAIDPDQLVDAPDLPACGPTSESCRLYINEATGVYEHCLVGSCGTRTQYFRSIHLEQVNANPEEILVTVTVKWGDNGNESFSVSTHLLNW